MGTCGTRGTTKSIKMSLKRKAEEPSWVAQALDAIDSSEDVKTVQEVEKAAADIQRRALERLIELKVIAAPADWLESA